MGRFTAGWVLVSTLVVAPAVSATTYRVEPDGSGDFPTIADAIDGAASGDTIALADGTFTGAGNRGLNFDGKSLVLRSESGVAESCILDTEQAGGRAFIFNSGEDSTSVLQSFSIVNGYGELTFSGQIFCGPDSSPRISGCIFRDNVGGPGASAFYCWDTSGPIISNCTFVDNSGASVYHGGAARMSGCTFAHNVATSSVITASDGSAFSNLIIAHNQGKAFGCYPADFSMTCCDIYGNDGGDWIDCIADKLGVDGNISAEPLFCDPVKGDYTLAENSPCIPENQPECGLIGAWPLACPASCTLELTPGRITTYYPCDGSFSTDLWIDHVLDLGSFDLCMGFDEEGLSFDQVVINTDFLGSTGRTVTPTGPSVCVPACQVDGIDFGATTSGALPGPSGAGRLATIFWQPASVGVRTEGLLCLGDWSFQSTDVPPVAIPVSNAPFVPLVHQPFCYGDFNGDGDISIIDVVSVAVRWGTSNGGQYYDETYDVNLIEPGNYCVSVADGVIDILDVQSIAARWGQRCSEPSPLTGPVDPGGTGPADRAGDCTGRSQYGATGSSTWLRISPEVLTIPGDIGSTGVFNLDVEDAPAIGAFETTLVFDPSVIRIEAVDISPFLGSTGRSVHPLEARIDNEIGVLSFGAWSTDESPGPEGSGTLAQVTVSIQSCPGEARIDIRRTTLADVDGWPQGLDGHASGTVITVCETTSSGPFPALSLAPQLLPSRPNPFAHSTTIPFEIPPSMGTDVAIELLIVDVSGRTIRKLANGNRGPGLHEIAWDGRDDRGIRAASGAYFCRLVVGETSLRKQIVLID